MAKTFDLYSSSGTLYLFMRARAVYDWQEADPAPPPLNILSLPYHAGRAVLGFIGCFKAGTGQPGKRNRFHSSNVPRLWMGGADELIEAVASFAGDVEGEEIKTKRTFESVSRKVGRLKHTLMTHGRALASITQSNANLEAKLAEIAESVKQLALAQQEAPATACPPGAQPDRGEHDQQPPVRAAVRRAAAAVPAAAPAVPAAATPLIPPAATAVSGETKATRAVSRKGRRSVAARARPHPTHTCHSTHANGATDARHSPCGAPPRQSDTARLEERMEHQERREATAARVKEVRNSAAALRAESHANAKNFLSDSFLAADNCRPSVQQTEIHPETASVNGRTMSGNGSDGANVPTPGRHGTTTRTGSATAIQVSREVHADEFGRILTDAFSSPWNRVSNLLGIAGQRCVRSLSSSEPTIDASPPPASAGSRSGEETAREPVHMRYRACFRRGNQAVSLNGCYESGVPSARVSVE